MYKLLKSIRSKHIFYLLVFLIPLNLGKHFILKSAFIEGLLVDYLIPTIYIQDILVLLLLTFWFFENKGRRDINISKDVENKTLNTTGNSLKEILNRKEIQTLIFLLFSIFLSILVSTHFLSSIISFIRLLLYFGFSFYVAKDIDMKKDFNKIILLFCISISFLGILSILQYIKQASLFNNYLILGEQPYSFSTQGIIKENIFGFTKIPSYGLFRHPNIFGGFLSIALIWIYAKARKNKFYLLPYALGLIGLLFTFSIFSYFSLLIGLILSLKKHQKLVYTILFAIFLFSFMLPLFKNMPWVFRHVSNISFERRSNLLTSSYKLIEENFLFGLGFNNSTSFIEKYLVRDSITRFIQPVHNIFVLVFLESGIFAFFFFIKFLNLSLIKAKNSLFLISLLQIIFLGCFDHYFLTMHQTLLLFAFVIGGVWTRE